MEVSFAIVSLICLYPCDGLSDLYRIAFLGKNLRQGPGNAGLHFGRRFICLNLEQHIVYLNMVSNFF